MKGFIREIFITAIVAVVIFVVLQTSIQSFIVVGASMEPSFDNGQRLLINKVTYRFGEPQRGDVIVFRPPDNQYADYIKRIIAVPGDTIEIKSGTVYVNNEPLEEDYILTRPRYTMEKTKIAPGEYFVLGDNRANSNDSHTGWRVPRENIVGKAWLFIWPPTTWGLVPDYDLEP